MTSKKLRNKKISKSKAQWNKYKLISEIIRIFEEEVIKGEAIFEFFTINNTQKKIIEKYKQEKLIDYYNIKIEITGFRIEAHTKNKDFEISMLYFETMKKKLDEYLKLYSAISIGDGVFIFDYNNKKE